MLRTEGVNDGVRDCGPGGVESLNNCQYQLKQPCVHARRTDLQLQLEDPGGGTGSNVASSCDPAFGLPFRVLNSISNSKWLVAAGRSWNGVKYRYLFLVLLYSTRRSTGT